MQGQYIVSQLKAWSEMATAILELWGVTAVDLAVARDGILTRAEADEGARVENESGEGHRATPKHFFAQSNQRLAALKCSSV